MTINAYTIPQDQYFDWEDIMDNISFTYDQNFPYLPDNQSTKNYYTSNNSLDNIATHHNPLLPVYENYVFEFNEAQHNRTDSRLKLESLIDTGEETEMQDIQHTLQNTSEQSTTFRTSLLQRAQDDLQPISHSSQNVDYLSFAWHYHEVDLWASRRHLKLTRNKNNEKEEQKYNRLMNATWRAVSVGRLNLKKVDPRSFDWSKDQDMTWLHGPFIRYSPLSSLSACVQAPQLQTLADISEKQQNRSIKSAMKHPSLTALLLRGSTLPVKNPKKRHNDNPLEEKRRQRQTLRFSSEVLQFTSFPIDYVKNNTVTRNSYNHKFSQIKSNSYPNVKNYIPQRNCNSKEVTHDIATLEPTKKSESRISHEQSTIEETKTSVKTVYQVPSGQLRTEQVSEDMAALRRAIKDAVDASQRNIPSYQYPNEMLIQHTITA